MIYTKESLKELISSKLKDYKLIVVSNREPYIHNYAGEEIKYIIPASGMVTALDPIIRAEGGTWIAYGSGDADKEVVDSKGHIAVPLIIHNIHYEGSGLPMRRRKGFTMVFPMKHCGLFAILCM